MQHAVLSPQPPLFCPQNACPAAVEQLRRSHPLPRKSYVIYFTARSGSSWVTDIVSQTGRLGLPEECFNPAFVPEMSRAMQAGTLEGYVDALQRRRARGGVFGCEVTFFQMKRVFGGPEEFLRHFGQSKAIWLIREDIVAQAVSLYKMQVTRIAHKAQSDSAARTEAEARFVYDKDQIRHWLEHLLTKEIRTEQMFATYDIHPLRLSYEVTTRMGAERVVNSLSHFLNEGRVPAPSQPSAHGKIGTGRNRAFATRFREEEGAMMARVKETRAPWLRRINRNPQTGLPCYAEI